MDISLEKIDLVKDRTGLGYKEAKEILEACDGNVIDAIISAEEKGESANKEMKTYTNAILSTLKEHAKKGNAMRVIVRKDRRDDRSGTCTLGDNRRVDSYVWNQLQGNYCKRRRNSNRCE